MFTAATIGDDELCELARRNPGWRIEWVDGRAIMSPPTGFGTGRRNSRLVRLLDIYAEAHGFTSSDSSGGFRLPDGAVIAPDASLVASERLSAFSADEQEAFLALVPDVVVELVSNTDDPKATAEKCERWRRYGVGYVAMLDPYREPKVRTWGEASSEFPDVSTIVAR
ncbi:MAG: Uma2 family endonuclease [Vulcanimicrobiaceae bacterium]